MSNLENNFGKPESYDEKFDRLLQDSIRDVLRTDESSQTIEDGNKLGIHFVMEVVKGLSKKLDENLSENIDYNEIIYPKIVQRITDMVGGGGFRIAPAEGKKNPTKIEDGNKIITKPYKDESGRDNWGIGRGLSDSDLE